MINVVTCVDYNYYSQKMGPWLEGSKRIKSANVYVVTLDFDVEESHKIKYPHVNYLRINKDQCPGINTNNCIQHGDYLKLFTFLEDTDVIVCIDGDCLIQRDFSINEVNALNNWSDNAIGMNWNAGYGDTLTAEAHRIFPLVSIQTIKQDWYPNTEPHCHNAGVIVANLKTWKLFYTKYMEYLSKVQKYFSHIAYQQWLQNWVAQTSPFYVDLLPQTFHSQGHYGHFPGCTLDTEGEFRCNGTLCWVRHKINWNPYPA